MEAALIPRFTLFAFTGASLMKLEKPPRGDDADAAGYPVCPLAHQITRAPNFAAD